MGKCILVSRVSGKHNDEAGMALLLGILVLTLGVLAIVALGSQLITGEKHVDRFEAGKHADMALIAANSLAKIAVENGRSGNFGYPDDYTVVYDGNETFVFPNMKGSGSSVTPLKLNGTLDTRYAVYTLDWSDDDRDNNGDSKIDDESEEDMYTAYAMAMSDEITRKSESTYSGTNVNVWGNAIFAGAGQSGGLINGNVSVHGSVHLLGDNINEGNTAITAMDISGTSLIHNNYDLGPGQGPGQAMWDRIPALPKQSVDGEEVESLEAVLRVKNGLVGMSGNSEIGQPQQVGNDFKETMDGVFNSDGWTGNSVSDDGGKGDPSAVFSDNGWDEDYDLGDKVPFPTLGDEYRDRDTGETVTNPSTGENYTHEEYFKEGPEMLGNGTPNTYSGDIDLGSCGGGGNAKVPNADLDLPINQGDEVFAALSSPTLNVISHGTNLMLSPPGGNNGGGGGNNGGGGGNNGGGGGGGGGNNDFFWNAETGFETNDLTGIDPDALRAADTDFIYYDSTSDHLEINGQIHIDGNLTICGTSGGNQGGMTYTGKAAVLVEGSASIETSLRTINADGTIENSFPNNVFGIMSKGDMVVGNTAQVDIMGAFYSESQISTSKQTNVFGTFVSKYFNMGKNVPNIFQVPALQDNLPLGMIGDYPILALNLLAYREYRN